MFRHADVVCLCLVCIVWQFSIAARLLGCESDGNAGVGSWGGVVAASAYICGTRGSGVLASACDVLEMSVVKGVGGVCDMCMWLSRAGWEVLG